MPLFISITLFLYRIFCLLCFLHRVIFFWRKKRPSLKGMKWNDPSHAKLLSLSAKEAAAQIRNGNLTSQELVQCYINRMKEVNPHINAAITYRFEQALCEAQEVDRILAEQIIPPEYSLERKPLLGIPCTIKESQSVIGMPHTGGLLRRKGVIATVDSPVVRRIRDAGAIIIAITNCSELCMWYETSNNVYGTTNNPYNLDCMVGGSSGGEGSINGATCSLFVIGSDIGGSVRMPCFFCGIFGHKHTPYLTPDGDEFPPTSGDAKSFLARSPMCRYSEDLPLILDVMAGNVIESKSSLTSRVMALDVARLNFFSIHNDGGSWYSSPMEQELITAQNEVVNHLTSHYGIEVKKTSLHKFRYSLNMWLTGLDENDSGPSFCDTWPILKPFLGVCQVAGWKISSYHSMYWSWCY